MAVEIIGAIVGIVNTVDKLRDAIKSRHGAEVLRERIEFAIDRLEFTKEVMTHFNSVLLSVQKDRDEIAARLAECASQKEQCEADKRNLASELEQERSFIPLGGVLSKRIGGGLTSEIPYCPTCRAALSDFGDFLGCGAHNGFKASIDADEFAALVRQANSRA